MPFNGSGAFTAPGADFPAVANTLIESAKFNNVVNDIATGLTTCITKDGQTTVTANIPLGGNKITGLAAATARTDAASIATIQDATGVYVGTVGGTADVITLTPSPAITAYAAGQFFSFIASGANTTNVTVAISGLAAKAITKDGSTALVAGDIASGALVGIRYDGTQFQLVSVASSQFALDSAVVHNTGNETVAGNKTFTGTTATQALVDLSYASAGQIKFPAAQNASADANTLDDYGEGTWTPSLGGTATYLNQTGTYTKIGRVVFFMCNLTVNLIGTGNTFTISGLPFTSSQSSPAAVANTANLATNVVSLEAYVSGAFILLSGRTAAANAPNTLSILGNSSQIRVSGHYEI